MMQTNRPLAETTCPTTLGWALTLTGARPVVLGLAIAILCTTGAGLTGCTNPKAKSRTVAVEEVTLKNTPYSGPRHSVAVGQFENRSNYMTGVFASGPDRLSMQAQQNLASHLTQSNRFMVVDRLNMAEAEREAGFTGQSRQIKGAQLLMTGAVTEFGRKEVGTVGLGGIISRSKTQVAFAKVTISVVDTRTSQIVYSAQGAGEFDLTNAHVLGFGTEAGYDATLTDRVLNLAMIEAVNRIVEGLEAGAWRPAD